MKRATWLELELNSQQITEYEVISAEYAGQLSAPETVFLKILSTQSFAEIAKALNCRLTVSIKNVDQSWCFDLVLFKIKVLNAKELMGRNCFLLELHSPLHSLTYDHLSPVLKNLSLAQAFNLILSQVGQSYRFEIDQFDINQPLPILKGLKESYFDFFQRILKFYGFSYYFDHQSNGEMVLSDHAAKFAPAFEIAQSSYAKAELLTEAHYDQNQDGQDVTVANVLTTGHPREMPEVLISGQVDSTFTRNYQADFSEFNEDAATQNAKFVFEAKAGAVNRNYYTGGGILFPAIIDSLRQELLVKTHFNLEFDAHERNRIRAIPLNVVSQPLNFRYRDEPVLQEGGMLLHGGVISDIAGNSIESVSVSGQGHYHVLLPEFVTDNAAINPVMDTRMVFPMQSDDHSQHFTVMNNSEGLLLYDTGILDETVLIGTGNSGGAMHITNQDTAQNKYWQDASHNKTAFINEGTFDRNAETGRHTAHMMETPSYHPEGSSSYVRMGDPIAQDGSYASQAAEGGLMMATTGHYQEDHAGGVLQLAGNVEDDAMNPIPVQRQMVQLDPTPGTPHILQTNTANLHNDLKTADNVRHSEALTDGLLTENLSAPSVFNTWTADNTHQIFVNQQLQQQGDINSLALNTQNTMLQADQKNLEQDGNLRTDQFTDKSITRAHNNNLEAYQTATKSTAELREQLQTQGQKIQTHTSTVQSGKIGFSNTGIGGLLTAQTGTTYLNDAVTMGSGSVSAQAITVAQAHAAKIENLDLHWIQAQYLDQHGKPITDFPYTIEHSDGTTVKGKLNDVGQTQRVKQLKHGTAKITFGDKEKLESQLKKQREQLKTHLNNILAKTKAEAPADVNKSWLDNVSETCEKFDDAVYHSVVFLVKGAGHLVSNIAQAQQLQDEGRYAVMTGNMQEIGHVQEASIAQGKAMYGPLFDLVNSGIDIANALCEDPETREILWNFAKEYYQSSSKLMIAKDVAEVLGNVLPTIIVGTVVARGPALFSSDGAAAAASDFEQVAVLAKAEVKTLNDLKKCHEVEEKEIDTLHKVQKPKEALPAATIEEFKGGGSALINQKNYKAWLKDSDFFGREDGQFITSKKAMDQMLSETNNNLEQIQQRLGVSGWEGDALYRVDIPDPLDYNPRLPNEGLSGANSQFIPGGKTSGGMPEIVIDQLPKTKTNISTIKVN